MIVRTFCKCGVKESTMTPKQIQSTKINENRCPKCDVVYHYVYLKDK